MSIPKDEDDPFALDDDEQGDTPVSTGSKGTPWSIAASRAVPSAASLLALPPEPGKVAKAAEAFRLEAPARAPVATAPQAPGAAERAREAYERARTATLQIEVEPFYAPPRIDPDALDALKKVAGEVTLDTALGPVALVAKTTGRLDRTELTFEDAATLRTLVDAFPGSRIIGLKSAAQAANDHAANGHAENGRGGHAENAPHDPHDGRAQGAEASARSARSGAPPHLGTRCSVCGEPQIETPSGPSCSNGHGGADPAGDAAEFPGDDNDPIFGGEMLDPSRTNTLEGPDPFALDDDE